MVVCATAKPAARKRAQPSGPVSKVRKDSAASRSVARVVMSPTYGVTSCAVSGSGPTSVAPGAPVGDRLHRRAAAG